MPRHRFRWESVPADVLGELAVHLNLDGDPIVQLRRRYGAKPNTQFVRETWPTLRDGWLRRDDELRAWVVEELRAAGLGDARISDEQRYLGSCRNAETLRQTVLAAFHVLGEGAHPGGGRAPAEDLPPAPTPVRGDTGGFDLDSAMESAWALFADRLGGFVPGLTPGSSLLISPTTAIETSLLEGAGPYIQVLKVDADRLRAEVSSNHYLDARLRLSETQEAMLLTQGWNAPNVEPPAQDIESGSDNYWVDLPSGSVARLVSMIVGTLRDVFDVPHPSFLDAPDLQQPAPPEVDVGTGTERLRWQVERLLEELFEAPVVRDPDGDIPIRSGSALVFVRVHPEFPVIELFAPLLVGADGDALALERLNRANRETPFAKLTWSAGQVFASYELWCEPFVADLVAKAVQAMLDLADDLDDKLKAEIGGRLFFDEAEPGDPAGPPGPDEDEEDAGEHPALLTILQLTYDGGELSAAQAAKICEHDRDLVLALIRHCEEQAINWRKAAGQAEDTAEATACLGQATSWGRTTTLLRGALREIALE